MLEGSVRKAGDRLRISVQLIDVSTDEHRWTQTYDRQLDNVFDIQLDVAERTAAALKLELLGPEREALHERPTHSLRAYEEFLRGIEASRRLLEGEPKDREVIDHFEAAIREDPEFAAAYCRLAGYLIAIMGVTRSARDVFPRARALVTRAVELNPTSSDALTARGNLLLQADHDWAGAEAVLRESIAINPSDTQAKFWLSVVLRTVGRFDEARAQLRRVIELDPLWIVPRFSLGEMCRSAGDVPEAIRVFEEIERRFGVSWESTGALAFAYASAGRYAEAMERVAPWAGSTEQLPRWMRAGVLTVLGRPEELRKVVEGYERGENSGRYLPQAFLAQWYALLHEKEKALATLEQDDREGDRTLWAHQWSEAFDSLRDEPRFRAILERSGLPVDPHRPLWFPPDHPLA